MLVASLIACALVWVGVKLALRFEKKWLGFLVLWPTTVVISTVGLALLFGFLAELAQNGVRDAMLKSASMGLGVSFVLFPVFFWVEYRKRHGSRD